jgi:hypothetical protein
MIEEGSAGGSSVGKGGSAPLTRTPDNSSPLPAARIDTGSPIEDRHSDKEKSHCYFNADLSTHLSEWPLIFLTNHTPLNQWVPEFGGRPGVALE